MQGGSDQANVERGPVWLDRVTAPGLMLIWPEEQGWAQYIGALVILDGRSLFDANGGFLIEPVREAAPGPTLSSDPVLAQNGAGVARVGGCPIVRHHRARPRAPSAAAGRRAATPPGLRDTPPPPVAPGPAVVGDVVPDRPSGPACGVLHEDAPRHRRRRRRRGHARRVRRSPPRPTGDERASVVAVPAAVDARTLPGQPAPATPGARPCALSPCRAHSGPGPPGLITFTLPPQATQGRRHATRTAQIRMISARPADPDAYPMPISIRRGGVTARQELPVLYMTLCGRLHPGLRGGIPILDDLVAKRAAGLVRIVRRRSRRRTVRRRRGPGGAGRC